MRSVPAHSTPVVHRSAGDAVRRVPGDGELAVPAGHGPGGARVLVPHPGGGAGAVGGPGRGVPSLYAPDQADHSLHCVIVGTLYLVSTPIGNLDDITLRALQVLEAVPLVAAEDTRHTLKLLTHFGLHRPLVSLHAHNEERQLGSILDRLKQHDIALVSDAGTPALSDPGVRLVSAAVARGFAVVPIPGPSAPWRRWWPRACPP